MQRRPHRTAGVHGGEAALRNACCWSAQYRVRRTNHFGNLVFPFYVKKEADRESSRALGSKHAKRRFSGGLPSSGRLDSRWIFPPFKETLASFLEVAVALRPNRRSLDQAGDKMRGDSSTAGMPDKRRPARVPWFQADDSAQAPWQYRTAALQRRRRLSRRFATEKASRSTGELQCCRCRSGRMILLSDRDPRARAIDKILCLDGEELVPRCDWALQLSQGLSFWRYSHQLNCRPFLHQDGRKDLITIDRRWRPQRRMAPR